jgi:hypothetical protein
MPLSGPYWTYKPFVSIYGGKGQASFYLLFRGLFWAYRFGRRYSSLNHSTYARRAAIVKKKVGGLPLVSLDSEAKLSRMCGTWALLLYGEAIAV